MARVTSLMLTAAMLAASSPAAAKGAASTPAAAADPMGGLLDQIQRAQDRKQFKRAADLAALASQRTDLRPVDRFVLAGLASASYGDAFEHGGAPRQPSRDPVYLCAQRAVLQEASALVEDPLKLNAVDNALGKVAAQLSEVAASGRAVPCELAPVAAPAPVAPMAVAVAPAAESPPAESLAVEAVPKSVAWLPSVDPVPAKSRADRGRVRAGVGMLSAGLVLFVPMAAVLAHRARGERELWALHAETAGGEAPSTQTERANALNRQYRVTSASAAVLGATGAALAMTGVIILATGRRRSLMAVAPWGARDGGGLILEGKF